MPFNTLFLCGDFGPFEFFEIVVENGFGSLGAGKGVIQVRAIEKKILFPPPGLLNIKQKLLPGPYGINFFLDLIEGNHSGDRNHHRDNKKRKKAQDELKTEVESRPFPERSVFGGSTVFAVYGICVISHGVGRLLLYIRKPHFIGGFCHHRS